MSDLIQIKEHISSYYVELWQQVLKYLLFSSWNVVFFQKIFWVFDE